MFFAPFALPFTWLLGLLSLATLGGGIWLLVAWFVGIVAGPAYLAAGLVLTLWAFFGRWVVLLFRRPGSDEPGILRPGSVRRITRPDGTSLYVESHGQPDAPALVLTHGAGTNRTSWYYVIRALSQHYRVIVWDMPGLGYSSKPARGDYSLERHARDLEAVLSLAGDERVVLAGHSMGGMVLLTFCRLFPNLLRERVAGLVLVDTSHTNTLRTTTGGAVLRGLQEPLVEPMLHLVAWLSPLVWLMSWLSYINGFGHLSGTLFGFAGTETRGQLDRAVRYNPEAWPAVLASEQLATLHYDATSTLSRVPVPALVVTGHLDRIIVPETARYMRDKLRDARLVVLEPAGHMAIFERHDTVVPALIQFCGAVLGRGERRDRRKRQAS